MEKIATEKTFIISFQVKIPCLEFEDVVEETLNNLLIHNEISSKIQELGKIANLKIRKG